MRFLVDNALSGVVAAGLRASGHDAVHVRELGMAAAEDLDIFVRAANDGRCVVTADLDFGTLHALGHATRPSVILLRRVGQRPPDQQVRLILAALPAIAEAIIVGCVAVIEPNRVRIRSLPIGAAPRSQ